MAVLILVFLTAFIVVLYSTPALIKVAVLKRLIDVPTEERKIHKGSVPTIGGIIIYAGANTCIIITSHSIINAIARCPVKTEYGFACSI